MSVNPSDGIGRRIRKYRLMCGLSAQKLSEKLGGTLSRSVIANIESGRKTDITVDQLISLSWALDVPPVVLALPVDEPLRYVDVGESPRVKVRYLIDWFNGGRWGADAAEEPSRVVASSILKALTEWRWEEAYLGVSLQRESQGEDLEDRIKEARKSLQDVESTLESLGVDLTEYEIEQ